MNKVSTNTLRESYLEFFESKDHARIPSAPLLPENDPTTLFTGSGMQPILPFLLGQPHSRGRRLVNSQKCFRATDMDDVGDNRHTTFFEMLGNWSLGDYFKQEQIPWVFEFLTEIGLDPSRLFVTVFRGNEELGIPRDEVSASLWQKLFQERGLEATIIDFPEKRGLDGGRIFYYDEAKNWWSRAGVPARMPDGEPGGADSEIFWDFGASLQLHEQSVYHDQPCHVNCDCGRFMEIGNSVFMEYRKTAGSFEALPQKNVDYGGGLERLAAAAADNRDVFRIDVFATALKKIERLASVSYSDNHTKAFRVILDHLRAATFLITDGVLPSNKDQGYFVRRLIRRAVRFAHTLGIDEPFCADVATEFVAAYQPVYPELLTAQPTVMTELAKEEEKFKRTLRIGLRLLQDTASQQNVLPAKIAFDLYQSFGFPIEMTEELCREQGIAVDRAGFDAALKQHQELSRASATQKFKGGLADTSEQSVRYHTATHLLHQALRTVLGNHVLQKGSNITPERLRFDFSHPAKLTQQQMKQVEDTVNEQIKTDLPVELQEMTVAQAKALGALGLFEHKYGEKVSVYLIGNFSKEICGGPHVERTGGLGTFKITKEEAASAGVRRIKAILE